MYYINPKPDEAGNYGNPRSTAVERNYALPDDLLAPYLEAMGFVFPKVDDEGTVTEVPINKKAFDTYQAAHPVRPEPDPPEDDTTLLLEMAADHEERICLLELGVM